VSASRRPAVVRLLTLAALAATAAATYVAPAATGGWTSHVSDGDAVTAGTTITTPTGASYAFSSVVSGKPVRWNPCAPIHWRANVARGPVGGLDVLKAAVTATAIATGTQWVYDGTTATSPTSSWLPTAPSTGKPVLIGWTDGAASDLLRGKAAQVLGMTRTVWFGHVLPTGTVAATQGAVIALDRTDKLPLRGNASWSSVALHELGHAMGLAHPHDSGELMNAILPTNLSGLQSGDRGGLKLVGRSQGCISL
jgi:Matrixin